MFLVEMNMSQLWALLLLFVANVCLGFAFVIRDYREKEGLCITLSFLYVLFTVITFVIILFSNDIVFYRGVA